MNKEEYLKQIELFFEKCKEVSAKKTEMYGASSIGELGLKGEFVQVHRKYSRLKRMLWESKGYSLEKEDTLKDTLIDMANYCAMIYSCIKKEKKRR